VDCACSGKAIVRGENLGDKPVEPVAFAAGTGAGIGAATAMLPGVVAGPGDFQDPGHHRYRVAWFPRAFFVKMLDDFKDVVF